MVAHETGHFSSFLATMSSVRSSLISTLRVRTAGGRGGWATDLLIVAAGASA
jgi:hypothetical protein